jgi:hypothetical protein
MKKQTNKINDDLSTQIKIAYLLGVSDTILEIDTKNLNQSQLKLKEQYS